MYYSDTWQLLEERIDDDSLFAPSLIDPDIDRHMQYGWGIRYIDDIYAHREDLLKLKGLPNIETGAA